MLAGCSSTLLSPRHRLRSEASAQFQACHIPTMSTQRLEIPCSFARKDSSRSSPSVRPVVSLSIENPIESKKTAGCSLKQSIKLPPTSTEARRENKDDFWDNKRSTGIRKRFAGDVSFEDDSFMSRTKRKRGNEEEGRFWYHHPSFNVGRPVSQISGPQVPFSLSCSGDEGGESVYFVPGDVIAPPLPPLANIPWFDSVVTEIADLGEKNVGTVGGEREASGSSSSTSSESRRGHGLALGLGGAHDPVHPETGNGSSRPNPTERPAEIVLGGQNGENDNHSCLELLSLLLACVEQIGSKNITAINHFLARLGEQASPRGSPVHRLVAYFTEGLALRVAKLWPHIFHITAPRDLDRAEDESGTTFRLLNQVSPIPKFIHFTSNEILLRAFEEKDRVHIIDFDIKQGLQWPSLFQSLASRPNPPAHVRITGIGESKQELVETGERLAGFANALNLPFEFHPVVDRLEDVRLWMLHVKEKETVAVNCVLQLHKMMYDTTGGAIRDFLGLIKSTNAKVVVVAEQEASHNEPSLEARFSNSLRYYSALFDSLDSSLPLESPIRMRIEEMFAREIRNIIACEGRDRQERHETFSRWREVMGQGGFGCIGVSDRELLQGQMMLRMYGNEDYRVEKLETENGGLTLSWLDQNLYTVSAWKPVDEAGASG